MSTYDVKIWDPKKIGDTAKGRWRVRWAVAGREHCKSFAAKPLADGFITTLKAAIADHQPFDETTGLPARPGHAARPRTWYEHARAYAEMKWPHQAATSRRSVRRRADHRHHRPGPPPPRRPRPRGRCAGRCSAGRSTPAPATRPRPLTSPPR